MNAISQVSDITYTDLVDYLNLDEVSSGDINTLNNLISISKSFICKYTGLEEEDLDDSYDFVICVLILCQDMWDNRALYVDNTNLNRVIESILDLHSVNLL